MEFVTEIDKKEQIKNILELGISNTENYNNDYYSYLQRKEVTIYIYIILHQSNTKWASSMPRM